MEKAYLCNIIIIYHQHPTMNKEDYSPKIVALLDAAFEMLKAGDTAKAISSYEEALQDLEMELDEYDPSLARIYDELSALYEEKEDFTNALKYLEKLSGCIQDSEGEFSDEASQSFIHMAELYNMTGDMASAELNYRKALQNYTSAKGPKNENLPQVYFELGSICAERGEKNKAKEYFEKAYATSVEINGEDNEMTQFIKEQLEQC